MSVAIPGHIHSPFYIISGHMPLKMRLEEADVTSLRSQSLYDTTVYVAAKLVYVLDN